MRDEIFINKVQVGADPGSEKPEAYTIWGALLKKKMIRNYKYKSKHENE